MYCLDPARFAPLIKGCDSSSGVWTDVPLESLNTDKLRETGSGSTVMTSCPASLSTAPGESEMTANSTGEHRATQDALRYVPKKRLTCLRALLPRKQCSCQVGFARMQMNITAILRCECNPHLEASRTSARVMAQPETEDCKIVYQRTPPEFDEGCPRPSLSLFTQR